MSLSKAARKAIEDRIGYLEDNAYRYRHFGKSPTQIVVAARQEREAHDLRAELRAELAAE